ncbi:MAG: patatin-like phospholipase family protein [bacterium]|jgi:NTE family protein|nr:patatin-like phospholipase family protein [bacterium]MDD3624086.1 patatin-like phospholipase family protein [Proteiniphilum sp.]MDD3967240.1 patatin-like phospholipase family protein [Proteiniphilum sp.]MDD4458502.1 patatin-like phospholipase family protein [Proteiniphilum sp.]
MAIFGKSYDYFLGYALSGGGARGFAHLGTLKVLESYGLKPDVIAGTSAGALAGVLYADGYHPDEIVDLFRKREFREFVSITIPRTGFLKSTGLHTFLKKNLRAKRFEELQLPFYAVATDWERACSVTFSEGDNLVDAVVASCSIPIVFNPQVIDNVPYVDGGILKNFPVTVIRKKCRYLVGVNVSLMIPPAEKESIRTMVERTFNLMSNANTLVDKSYCDILIETHGLERVSMFDLHNQNQIMEAGYQAAANTMAEKRSLEIVRRCHRHVELQKKIQMRLQRINEAIKQ